MTCATPPRSPPRSAAMDAEGAFDLAACLEHLQAHPPEQFLPMAEASAVNPGRAREEPEAITSGAVDQAPRSQRGGGEGSLLGAAAMHLDGAAGADAEEEEEEEVRGCRGARQATSCLGAPPRDSPARSRNPAPAARRPGASSAASSATRSAARSSPRWSTASR